MCRVRVSLGSVTLGVVFKHEFEENDALGHWRARLLVEGVRWGVMQGGGESVFRGVGSIARVVRGAVVDFHQRSEAVGRVAEEGHDENEHAVHWAVGWVCYMQVRAGPDLFRV